MAGREGRARPDPDLRPGRDAGRGKDAALSDLRRAAREAITTLGTRVTAARIGISPPTLRRFVSDERAAVARRTWRLIARWSRSPTALLPPQSAPRAVRRPRDAELLARIRGAVQAAASARPYRQIADEIGVKHGALHKFATGDGVPYNRMWERLCAWYERVCLPGTEAGGAQQAGRRVGVPPPRVRENAP